MTVRGGGGGSTLAHNDSRRRQLLRTRKNLGMDVERGAPQAPTRTQPQPVPPPQAPAQPPAGQRAGNTREAMLQQVSEFLGQRRGQRRGEAPRPQQPPVEAISTRPGPTDRLAPRIDQLGATNRPIETQFYRLAGRQGTPREIAIFRSRLELERQLQRPPTETELRVWMARPASLGALVEPAVERPERGPARPGAPAAPGGA